MGLVGLFWHWRWRGFGSASARAETLNGALAAAYKFNPRLDAARAIQRATDEEVPRALSGYRPSVTGSADTSYEKQTTRPTGAGVNSTTESNPRGYEIGAVQPIFRGFRTKNAVSAAEATVRAGWEALRTTEASVLLEGVTAYMDVVRDQAILTLRENNVTVLTRDLKATQDRFAVGEVTRTDVAQAQARRAGAVAALDLARANLKTSRATFERVVGHPPSGLVEPRPSKQVPKSLGASTEIGSRESPGVVAALYREQAARFNIDLIRGERLPTVQLEANYGRRFDASESDRGDGDDDGDGAGERAVLHRRRGGGAGAPGQAHARAAAAGDRAGADRGAGAGGDGVVAAAGGAGGSGVRTRPAWMPTASRWPACARRSGLASARCWTCSTPSRSC